MNDEMVKFWLPLWKTAMWAFVAVVACGLVSCNVSKVVLLDAVKNGADPLVARCAFEGADEKNSCVLLYSKK